MTSDYWRNQTCLSDENQQSISWNLRNTQ